MSTRPSVRHPTGSTARTGDMSARLTVTQPAGSVARTATAVAHVNTPSSQYANFYLGSVWEWTKSGIARVNNHLESLNVDRPTYKFNEYLNIWQVRCPRSAKSFIRRNFVLLLNQIEDEFIEQLQEAELEVLETGGMLNYDELHDDVRMPISLPKTPKLPGRRGDQRPPAGNAPGDGLETVSLIVPDELRDVSNIAVWQELQAVNRNFEGAVFLSSAARQAIESACNVQIVMDAAQKVVFIGLAPLMDNAAEVKAKLTRLLQEFQNSRRLPKIAHHVFFVESATPYFIDTREISWVNPILPRSTILDPWKFAVPETYGALHKPSKDTGAFVLRACLSFAARGGLANHTWSMFGPREASVFDGEMPTRSSKNFEGLRAITRRRAALKSADAGAVDGWLEELGDAPTAPEATMMAPDVDTTGTATPIIGGGEDDPIPLTFDPSRRDDLPGVSNYDGGDDEPTPLTFSPSRREDLPRVSNFDGGDDEPIPLTFDPSKRDVSSLLVGTEKKLEPSSILDQQDAILRDPRSLMQRALKPSLRHIEVPDPDFQAQASLRLPIDKSNATAIITGVKAKTSDQELAIFNISILRLLERSRACYGDLRLRAAIGRYYVLNLPWSARALNKDTSPANGWLPDDLRDRLEVIPNSFFTSALSSWGNDADFLARGAWQRHSRAIYFDFRFHLMMGEVPLDLVLEVNAQDYTWKIRCMNNACDDAGVTVHCLTQHWDFQVQLTYDRTLELRHNWGMFAEALIESLEVKPPMLEFQHTFHEAPIASKEFPITIADARVRQVCRFQSENLKHYLDITRILPTQPKPSCDPKYRKVEGTLAKCTPENPLAGDNQKTGEFAQWFEASVSSVRLEELLKQNQELVPGGEVKWNAQQLQDEGILSDLFCQTAEVVKGMDGVGVECDNGHEQRRPATSFERAEYPW